MMKDPKGKTKRSKEWLTKEEYNRLINNPNISRKDEIIISLLYNCALRVSELSNIKAGDIDIVNATITIWEAKWATDPALVPVPATLLKMINQWIKENKINPTQHLISSNRSKYLSRTQIHRIIKSNAEQAGINKEITTHTFRSYAVNGITEDLELHICLMQVYHWNKLADYSGISIYQVL